MLRIPHLLAGIGAVILGTIAAVWTWTDSVTSAEPQGMQVVGATPMHNGAERITTKAAVSAAPTPASATPFFMEEEGIVAAEFTGYWAANPFSTTAPPRELPEPLYPGPQDPIDTATSARDNPARRGEPGG